MILKQQPLLTVTEEKVSDLLPYANNAKIHTSEQVDQIANSIREFGNCDPIAAWHNADGDMEIVEGHGRVMALLKLGIETAPVIFLDHLSDDQRRAYTHVHNQTTMSTGWDFTVLEEDLGTLDYDFGDFGFNINDVDFDAGGPFAPEEMEPEKDDWEPGVVSCPHCGEEFQIDSALRSETPATPRS